MTVRIKGVTVELNGTEYVIPPIALGALEQSQNRFPLLSIAPMPP